MLKHAVNMISYNPDLGIRGAYSVSLERLLELIDQSATSVSAKSGENALLNLYSYDLLATAGEAHTRRDIFETYCTLSLVNQLRLFPKKALKLQSNPPAHLVVLDWMGKDQGYNNTVYSVSAGVFSSPEKLKASVEGKLKVNAHFRPNEEHVFANVIDVPLVKRMLNIDKDIK